MNRENQLFMTLQRKSFAGASDYKGLVSFHKLVAGNYCLKPEQSVTSDLAMWMIIRSNENVTEA